MPCKKEELRNVAKQRRMITKLEYNQLNDLCQRFLLSEEQDYDRTKITKIALGYVLTKKTLFDNFNYDHVKSELDFVNFSMRHIDSGFFIVLSSGGVVSYVSNEVNSLLGLDVTDLLGSRIFCYLHSEDKQKLGNILNCPIPVENFEKMSAFFVDSTTKTATPTNFGFADGSNTKNAHNYHNQTSQLGDSMNEAYNIVIRMKNYVTNTGKRIYLRDSFTYIPVRVNGKLLTADSGERYFVAYMTPLSGCFLLGVPLWSKSTFLLRTKMDGTIFWVSRNIAKTPLGKDAEHSFIGKKLYDIVTPQETKKMHHFHGNLLSLYCCVSELLYLKSCNKIAPLATNMKDYEFLVKAYMSAFVVFNTCTGVPDHILIVVNTIGDQCVNISLSDFDKMTLKEGYLKEEGLVTNRKNSISPYVPDDRVNKMSFELDWFFNNRFFNISSFNNEE